MDRDALAAFLRERREALVPEDVGLHRGNRRRTPGLRREEVAALIGMSTDYYGRLERSRGPRPSDRMLAAIALGLRLTFRERDTLFSLAGRPSLQRGVRRAHVDHGLMRIVDRLGDTPAHVVTVLGETLVQTPLATALFGDETVFRGPERSFVYRWFMLPGTRSIHPADDHELHGRVFASGLRAAVARDGADSSTAALVRLLHAESPEFAAFWAREEMGLQWDEVTRFLHPEVGEIALHRTVLVDVAQEQRLLVYTATPGTESAHRLRSIRQGPPRQGVPPALDGEDDLHS
jgi:transcriptional regulator with XRE-family HTH domain